MFLGCGKLEENTLPPSSSTESSNKATIELDNNGCLVSHNAEAVLNDPLWPSIVSQYKYKTLVWNCADYLDYKDSHVEKLFTSEDGGQCYWTDDINYPEEWYLIASGDCTTKAIAPLSPSESARLTEFQMNFVNLTSMHVDPSLNCQNCYAANYRYSAKIENTGNITLWWEDLQVSSSAGDMLTGISLSNPIPPGGSHQFSGIGPFLFAGPGTYDLKAELREATPLNDWGNITFDSMTTTIVVP